MLKDICEIPSPSNNESKLIDYFSSIKVNNFKFEKTKKNSCIFSYSNSKNKKTILIDAHIDNVHYRILRISPSGFVVCTPVGFDSSIFLGHTLQHLDSGIEGCIINSPPHLKMDNPYKKEIYVDFGMNVDELKKKFKIGDVLIYDYKFIIMNNTNIVSRGLDNKGGASVLLSLLKYFDKNPTKLKYNLMLHLSSREEIGFGSFSNILNSNIDEIIVLDCSYDTNIKDLPNNIVSPSYLGNGPIISRNYEVDNIPTNKFRSLCEKYKIPHQLSVSQGFGGTNNLLYSKYFNSYTSTILIPLRNMHSPSEVINIEDLKNTFKLFVKYLTV